MKKYLLSFSITFLMIFYTFVPQCFASTYVPVVAPTASFISSAKFLAPALLPFAPEIALVACVLVGGGIVFENREQVITMAGSIYKDLKASGRVVANVVGQGYSLTADGVSFVYNRIAQLKATPTYSVPAANLSVEGVDYTAILGYRFQPYQTWYWKAPYMTDYLNPAQSCVNWFTFAYVLADGSYALNHNYIGWSSDVVTFPAGTVWKVNPTADSSISVTFPTAMFPTATSTPIPYVGDTAIAIPATLPLTSDAPLTNDWAGDLVGTNDYTKAFPADVPIDPPADAGILQPLIDWLTIDWDLVTPSMDFSDLWRKHFKPFYDTGDALKNINATPQTNSGKFYMKIPKAMGGDDGQHVVLDFTPAAPYLSWARIFIKYSLWLGLGMYILKLFEPKITIN